MEFCRSGASGSVDAYYSGFGTRHRFAIGQILIQTGLSCRNKFLRQFSRMDQEVSNSAISRSRETEFIMWLGLLGHDAVADHFRRTIAAGRLAATYLFVGPPGVGKRTFALELARSLL